MYEEVRSHNRKRKENVKLINFIDGGGWIDRNNDLDKMIRYSDRHFTNRDIEDGTFQDYLNTELPIKD